MRALKLVIAAALVLSLANCGSSRIVPAAEQELLAGNWLRATILGVDNASMEATKAALEKYPDHPEKLANELKAEISGSVSAHYLANLRRSASLAATRGLLPKARHVEIEMAIKARANTDFISTAAGLPALRDLVGQKAKQQFLEAALAELEVGKTAKLDGMVALLNDAPAESSARQRFVEALLKTKIPKADFDRLGLASDISSRYIAVHRKTIQVLSDDRLAQEDIIAAINDRSTWLRATREPAPIQVSVQKLQWDFSTQAESSQTISYAQHQVNLLGAVLLMPDNATYSYDLIKGGASLSYAFEVKGVGGDKLVRNSINRSHSRCQNARIVNVFGGVSPAEFVANDHMRTTCSGGGSPVDPDSMRREAMRAVADAVLQIAGMAPLAPAPAPTETAMPARKVIGLELEVMGGAVVVRTADSAARSKGIAVGTIIREVAQQPVSSVEAVQRLSERAKAEGKKAILLLVSQNGRDRFIALPLH